MGKKKILSLAVFNILLLITQACGFNVSAAVIQDAYMAFDPKGEDVTTFFGQADTFHCIVELVDAPDGSLVKALWIVVEAENIAPDYLIDAVERDMRSGIYNFSLRPKAMWPIGKYKVELYLDGELDRTLGFEVR